MQTLTLEIPEVPQEYWKGDEKQVQIRVCVPKGANAKDFNVSYSITAELVSRDSKLQLMTVS